VRLAALVESEAHVCCRYRLAALRPALSAAGHAVDFHPLPQSLLGRFNLGRTLTSYDAVILQRKLLPQWVVARLRRRVQRLIFDFDDALWLRDSYSGKGFDDPKRAARFRATIGAADLVIAGNEYLAAEARTCAPAQRVRIVPTCVDVARYPLAAHDAGAAVRLVWVGSSSTLRGLERFAPTLSAIGHAVPGARLKLICDRFTEFPDLTIERCTWNGRTEAAEIAAADVGIGWVPDDPWSRGKCGLKVLQYQAAGLPVVANPVGVQAHFVRDGETGFRATTTDEWVTAVRALAADVALRKRLGAAGRKQVEGAYSVETGGRMWVNALAGLSCAARKAG
jgi:glycosyltransferase involved in cell wall biosynthesis